jgi:hypothetical protein
MISCSVMLQSYRGSHIVSMSAAGGDSGRWHKNAVQPHKQPGTSELLAVLSLLPWKCHLAAGSRALQLAATDIRSKPSVACSSHLLLLLPLLLLLLQVP